jgi:hypothetical protein
MLVKFWLASIFKAIRIRLNRRARRRMKKRRVGRAAVALSAACLTTFMFTDPAAGQCTPLFPGQTFAAGDRPSSVTTGDFNGDGVTDLAIANVSSDYVSVLLGVGDGTFAPQATNGAG